MKIPKRRSAALAGAFVVAMALQADAQCSGAPQAGARRLSAVFDAGRVLLAPVSPRGDTTFFILDSGGGFNAIEAARVAALRLPTLLEGTAADTQRIVAVSAFGDSLAIPVPNAGYPRHGFLAVVADLQMNDPHMYQRQPRGFLGGGWWADRTWRIDYLRHELWIFPGQVLPADNGRALPPHDVPLHFRTTGGGRRPTNFARFTAGIGGDSLSLLLDTGATTLFTDSANAVVGDGGPRGRAGSSVSSDIFARWHTRHPEWRVIARGEYGRNDMIEVPSMSIGGFTIGPVWWERRDSTAFHKLMDPLLDRPIQGSLGGAAFQYLSVTIDYPRAMACFAQ
jgi:hypothetical protein